MMNSQPFTPDGHHTPPPLSTDIPFKVVKRTGQAVPFDASKIAIAMTRAFLAVEGHEASGSARVKQTVNAKIGRASCRERV